jgi:hypothetical protein
MYLVELFLPVYDNDGRRFATSRYTEVRQTLIDKFGGLTAFTRAPAEGSERSDGTERRDDIIVFEVMTEILDAPWWNAYRKSLEALFSQERLVVRATRTTVL